jgi:predicted dehydrogenase/threonine dehydrogenase-like Zn-dependent dehydrogenase
MKQILQNLRTGATELADVPSPGAGEGRLLIRTTRSLISAGTERMLVEFGRANPIQKARQQPDKVRQVLDKIRTDGLMPTIDAVRNKLDQPLPMGYCNVGVVAEVGPGVSGYAAGDRVASNGWHAEMVSVPVNLCARVPDNVGDDEAAFTVIASIALQGIRLVQPTLGESVAVTGLGLIGLLTVQLLRAQGCRVLGLDFDESKLELARRFGAETVNLGAGQDPVAAAEHFSRGRGMDAVVITAATDSNEPVHQAALMSRKRGRIVLVGVAGLELSREDFYAKELSFQVSCSYGPGRYDSRYEEEGVDYPVGFVRWTEQRNFEAILDMLSDGRLDVAPLISHRFALEDAERAYALVTGSDPSLGIVLEYGGKAEPAAAVARRSLPVGARPAAANGVPAVGFVGSGNYATAILMPAFKAAGARLATVASSRGVSGVHAAKKFGFAETTTSASEVLGHEGVDAVVIATRHDSHAPLVVQALEAGKHVFVEKPLCLTLDELAEVEVAYARAAASDGAGAPLVMVGFNRRFAPHVRKIKELLRTTTGPKAFVMTVNAGALPPDHWTQDRAVGGGRVIGEGCHFMDLLRHLAGAPITSHDLRAMESATGDTVAIHLGFADGSIGTIHYLANGSKSFPKERLEVFAQGGVLQLDNYRRLTGYGWPGFEKTRVWRQDKGQTACAAAFVDAIRTGAESPIPFDEIVEVSRVSIELAS